MNPRQIQKVRKQIKDLKKKKTALEKKQSIAVKTNRKLKSSLEISYEIRRLGRELDKLQEFLNRMI